MQVVVALSVTDTVHALSFNLANSKLITYSQLVHMTVLSPLFIIFFLKGREGNCSHFRNYLSFFSVDMKKYSDKSN